LAIVIIAFIIEKNNNGSKIKAINKQTVNVTPTNTLENKIFGCTRTTRLENKPPYDRALSLIEEKYNLWEKSGEGKGSWYFFPSQLVRTFYSNFTGLDYDEGLIS